MLASILTRTLTLILGIILLRAIITQYLIEASIYIIVGIILITISSELGNWFSETMLCERTRLSNSLKVEPKLIKYMLRDFGGVVGQIWLFRVLGILIIGFSVYHFLVLL